MSWRPARPRKSLAEEFEDRREILRMERRALENCLYREVKPRRWKRAPRSDKQCPIGGLRSASGKGR
jgi:hypothetical protein